MQIEGRRRNPCGNWNTAGHDFEWVRVLSFDRHKLGMESTVGEDTTKRLVKSTDLGWLGTQSYHQAPNKIDHFISVSTKFAYVCV